MQVKSIAECSKRSIGEHSAILMTFIKLAFGIKIFVLYIFEWQFYTGFTVKFMYHMDIVTRKSDCLHANNKNAGQPEHLSSLIIAFVICHLERKMAKLASHKISIILPGLCS